MECNSREFKMDVYIYSALIFSVWKKYKVKTVSDLSTSFTEVHLLSQTERRCGWCSSETWFDLLGGQTCL